MPSNFRNMQHISLRITPLQHAEISQFMKEEGCVSRSEFVRFLLKFYKHARQKTPPPTSLKERKKRGDTTLLRRMMKGAEDC